MFKKLFDSKTTKFEVLMAATTAVAAVWKAVDTYRDYKSDITEMENQK